MKDTILSIEFERTAILRKIAIENDYVSGIVDHVNTFMNTLIHDAALTKPAMSFSETQLMREEVFILNDQVRQGRAGIKSLENDLQKIEERLLFHLKNPDL